MSAGNLRLGVAAALCMALGAVVTGCIKTEHKIETTHRIEAHIIIDIRHVRVEAQEMQALLQGVSDAGSQRDAARTPQEQAARQRRRDRVETASAGSTRGILGSSASAIGDGLTKGCFGENNRGYLELLECNALNDQAERARLENLLRRENEDRRVIHAAVAVRQGFDPGQSDRIGEIFAIEIRMNLKSGQAFQIPSRQELHEEFLLTPLGRSFAQDAVDAWVRVP